MKPIDMSKEPTCAKEHNPPEMIQTVTTGPGDRFEYVGCVHFEGWNRGDDAASQGVRFDQKGCMYIPHVLAMEADQPLIDLQR